MSNYLIKKIKKTLFYGTVKEGETRRFDEINYFNNENFYEYRLSKIKIFLGNKDGRELLLGIQTFYTNTKGKEFANEENRDSFTKVSEIKEFEIPKNDYITNFYLRTEDSKINQIKLITKKGKEFIAGSSFGIERIERMNEDKNNRVLYFYGGYRKNLEALGVGYIPVRFYASKILGYLFLRKKLKIKKFYDEIISNYDKLEYDNKVLFKVVCLPDTCFQKIINYIFD